MEEEEQQARLTRWLVFKVEDGDDGDDVGDGDGDGDGDDNVDDDDDGSELALPAASRVIIMIQSKMKLLPSPLNSKEPCCQVHSTL